MSAALIDTNVFIYAYDPADPVKHDRAIRLIDEVGHTGNLVLSAQVLNELAWTLLRKGATFGLSTADVRDIIDEVALSARILPLTPDLTLKALEVGIPRGCPSGMRSSGRPQTAMAFRPSTARTSSMAGRSRACAS